jgi:hypothetical protein
MGLPYVALLCCGGKVLDQEGHITPSCLSNAPGYISTILKVILKSSRSIKGPLPHSIDGLSAQICLDGCEWND